MSLTFMFFNAEIDFWIFAWMWQSFCQGNFYFILKHNFLLKSAAFVEFLKSLKKWFFYAIWYHFYDIWCSLFCKILWIGLRTSNISYEFPFLESKLGCGASQQCFQVFRKKLIFFITWRSIKSLKLENLKEKVMKHC